jgi:hypothetical protein
MSESEKPASAADVTAGNPIAIIDFNKLLTQPLSAQKVAYFFDINPKRVRELVATMDGVKRFGKQYRLPLCYMPPRYLLGAGFVEVRPVPPSWPDSRRN